MAAKADTVRPLHWVFKVGNLRKTIAFCERVLGMHVLRHEEFSSGCEATCNGPYDGSWSKTMIGHGAEHSNFVFELTYNYGVESYKRGHDLRCIVVGCTRSTEPFVPFKLSTIENELSELGLSLDKDESNYVGDKSKYCGQVADPDGTVFQFVDMDSQARTRDPIQYVSYWVNDVKASEDYWCGVLGAELFERKEEEKAIVVGFGASNCKLELVQVQAEKKVDHADAFGRIAFATTNGPIGYFEASKASDNTIINEPIVLPTPGKADVEVTILADPDGYEICFVGEPGFADLSTLMAGQDFIDWPARKEMQDLIQKYKDRKNKE